MFRRGTHLCFRKFRVTKNSMPTRGISRFSIQKLLSHSTEKFRRGTLRSIKKFRASRFFMHKKRISPNSVKKSLSHSGDKSRQRTVLCFEKILVSKSFKQRRGEASPFCRNFFYLTGPKKFRQGTIVCCVSENYWIGNFFYG